VETRKHLCLKLWRTFAALILALALAACGGDKKPEPTATMPDADVTQILQQASQQIATTESMKFTLEIEGKTMIDKQGTMQILGARGTLKRPGSVDVQFQLRILNTQTVSIRMITTDTGSWTTDLITGAWGPAPSEFGYDPALLFDTENGLGPIMGKVTDPVLVGQEDLDGTATWHVRGTVTQAVVGPVTSNTMRGDPVELDLWIDATTSDLLKIRLAEPKDAGLDDPATWTMTLRGQNEPVTIESPV
jgi:lipoprotein LprG